MKLPSHLSIDTTYKMKSPPQISPGSYLNLSNKSFIFYDLRDAARAGIIHEANHCFVLAMVQSLDQSHTTFDDPRWDILILLDIGTRWLVQRHAQFLDNLIEISAGQALP